jgi:hypothetical protein
MPEPCTGAVHRGADTPLAESGWRVGVSPMPGRAVQRIIGPIPVQRGGHLPDGLRRIRSGQSPMTEPTNRGISTRPCPRNQASQADQNERIHVRAIRSTFCHDPICGPRASALDAAWIRPFLSTAPRPRPAFRVSSETQLHSAPFDKDPTFPFSLAEPARRATMNRGRMGVADAERDRGSPRAADASALGLDLQVPD